MKQCVRARVRFRLPRSFLFLFGAPLLILRLVLWESRTSFSGVLATPPVIFCCRVTKSGENVMSCDIIESRNAGAMKLPNGSYN